MKKVIKIFGIGAALLLLMIGIAPTINSDSAPPPSAVGSIEGIGEVYIENWDSFVELCKYWDEHEDDSALSEELKREQERIIQELHMEIIVVEISLPPQPGGITWFFKYGGTHEWWFSAGLWGFSVDVFDYLLRWQYAWDWMILAAQFYLQAVFLFKGTPGPWWCKAMARDIIYQSVGDSHRYEVINDAWDGERGIWIEVNRHWLPEPRYSWGQWGHQPEDEPEYPE